MKSYTGTPICGGEKIEGELISEGADRYIRTPSVCIKSTTEPCINPNFVKFYAARVNPATVEPVRMAVKHERTLVGDYRCPACNAAFIEGPGRTPFCGNCGQALEWPEDKEE